MASRKESIDEFKKTWDPNVSAQESDKWYTRFLKTLNRWFNPQHSWFGDYSDVNDFGSSVENQITKNDLTGAEKAANAFTANEAQKQRDWEAEMQNTAYQRQVADMRAAGVNPAMAMSNGQPSTPSGASASSVALSSAGLSMSDLMQLFMLPLNKKALQANIEKTNADTERQRAETNLTAAKTENMALVNAYYPSVTEAGLDKVLSAIGVDLSTIDRNDAETALKNVQTLISEKENKYADEFFHWRSEYEKAHTQESKDSAAVHAAQALLTAYENQYARENGFKLSSSAALAVVSAIEYALGLDSIEGDNPTVDAVVEAVKNHPGVNAAQATGQELGEKTRQKIKKAYDRFERWRNRPKRVF